MSRLKVTRARNEKRREIISPTPLLRQHSADVDRHNIKSLNIRSDKEAEGGTWNRTRKGWLMRPLSGHCSLLPERALARVERHMRQSPCQGIDRHNNQQSRAHD